MKIYHLIHYSACKSFWINVSQNNKRRISKVDHQRLSNFVKKKKRMVPVEIKVGNFLHTAEFEDFCDTETVVYENLMFYT